MFELARSARVTLDIGAHVGYYALLASLANPEGRVYAFEPLHRVRQRLLRNVDLNTVGNVTCVAAAVGGQDGRGAFFHVRDGIPSSSSMSGDFMRSIVAADRLVTSDVEVITVDSFVARNPLAATVDLVKIDTETTEVEVLRGMAHTLETARPTIICEVLTESTGRALTDLLRPLSYEFFLLTDDGPAHRDEVRPSPEWRNYAFVPQ